MREGDRSPWGKIQHVSNPAPGCWVVSTAGHGGVKLDRDRNAKVPKGARRSSGWYEEDCEAVITLAVHDDLRAAFGVNMDNVAQSLQRWLPHEYSALVKAGIFALKD